MESAEYNDVVQKVLDEITKTRLEEVPDDSSLTREDRVLLAGAALLHDLQIVRSVLSRLNGQVCGSVVSPVKAASSRENGRKGGRPRKSLPEAIAR